jgi:dipeptidyl aminopeptidase/acylaminoacyl peptidase
MGLVRYGELYRCGVAWAAVSDIDLMYTNTWSDTSDDIRRFDMPAMIGDPVRDAAQLAQTSPLKQVASIKRPLLLAHGGIDRRVPLEHATKLRDALEAQKAPVSWIQYPEEGHGWMRPETRIGFYQRMEAFLAANIGPGAEVTKAAAN